MSQPSFSIEFEGLEDVHAMLNEVPDTIAAKGLYRAHAAAVEVVERELLARTPRSDHDGEYPHLTDSVVSTIEIDQAAREGESETGFGVSGFKAYWVEYGHRMVGHRPLRKEEGTVESKPFMRPTTAAAADDVIEAFGDSIRATVDEEYS